MFASPLSFEGRIRRLEYGLSYLIYILLYTVTAFVWQEFPKASLLFYLFYAVLIWFLLAQGAKRCHDLDNSGFYQFIPFYMLLMLFQEGKKGENKYGKNPKNSEHRNEIDKTNPPISNTLNLLVQISSFVLLNTLVGAIILEYLPTSDIWLFFSLMISIVPCYFIALLFQRKIIRDNKTYLRQRIIYACFFYICIRMYSVYFRGSEIQIQTIILELFVIAFILAITYIPFILFKTTIKKRPAHNEV